MQPKPKTQAQSHTKKTFDWGLSSTSIDFMRAEELAKVRDGSANDCGCGGGPISPLPIPRQKRPNRGQK